MYKRSPISISLEKSTVALQNLSDLIHDSKQSKSLFSWKKSENIFPSEYLNINSEKSKEGRKEYSSKSKNASTLSLHISAYENSVESAAAASESFEADNICKNKSNFIKNLNKHMILSPTNINTPFEFPRQQLDDETDPAIMQFSASQKLLNPNQGNGDSATTKTAMRSSSVLPEKPRFGGIQKSRIYLKRMDQEKCYHVDEFDASTVDVNRPATTVDEYLKQVIVNRMNCTEVAYAKMDSTKIKPSIAQAAPPANDKCPHAPNRKWQDEFIIRFGHDREEIESQRHKIKALKTKNLLPQAGDGQGWINVCLRQRSPYVPIETSQEPIYAAHKGTPPTLRFVLSFSDVLVDKLLSHLFKAFKENGYSRALFEWFYALLLVVKVPIQHDTMAILRSFTKLCRQKRVELSVDEVEVIREYTIFIAIVSLFFSQKDLAD